MDGIFSGHLYYGLFLLCVFRTDISGARSELRRTPVQHNELRLVDSPGLQSLSPEDVGAAVRAPSSLSPTVKTTGSSVTGGDVDLARRRRSTSKRCRKPRLRNGKVHMKRQKSEVYFKCRRKFQLVGSKYARCEGGRWSKPLPVCVRGGCVPPDVDGTRLSARFWYDQAVMAFSCPDGYDLQGPKSIFCDGTKWNRTPPVCIEKITELPPSTEAARSTTDFVQVHLTSRDRLKNESVTSTSMFAKSEGTSGSLDMTTGHVEINIRSKTVTTMKTTVETSTEEKTTPSTTTTTTTMTTTPTTTTTTPTVTTIPRTATMTTTTPSTTTTVMTTPPPRTTMTTVPTTTTLMTTPPPTTMTTLPTTTTVTTMPTITTMTTIPTTTSTMTTTTSTTATTMIDLVAKPIITRGSWTTTRSTWPTPTQETKTETDNTALKSNPRTTTMTSPQSITKVTRLSSIGTFISPTMIRYPWPTRLTRPVVNDILSTKTNNAVNTEYLKPSTMPMDGEINNTDVLTDRTPTSVRFGNEDEYPEHSEIPIQSIHPVTLQSSGTQGDIKQSSGTETMSFYRKTTSKIYVTESWETSSSGYRKVTWPRGHTNRSHDIHNVYESSEHEDKESSMTSKNHDDATDNVIPPTSTREDGYVSRTKGGRPPETTVGSVPSKTSSSAYSRQTATLAGLIAGIAVVAVVVLTAIVVLAKYFSQQNSISFTDIAEEEFVSVPYPDEETIKSDYVGTKV